MAAMGTLQRDLMKFNDVKKTPWSGVEEIKEKTVEKILSHKSKIIFLGAYFIYGHSVCKTVSQKCLRLNEVSKKVWKQVTCAFTEHKGPSNVGRNN